MKLTRSRLRRSLRQPRASTRGLSLVEIAVTLSVLITVLTGFSQALVSSMVASRAARETAVATEAARSVMESLQATDFASVFQANNSVAGDDPGGVTLRLAGFEVEGLPPRPEDADGMCGEILFPEQVVWGSSQLREDIVNSVLNMPRDLNGDGVLDGADHSGDYQILPVVVRVDWRGAAGNSRVQFRTILANY
jgi:type II secretory pathway pseudopilin PulG